MGVAALLTMAQNLVMEAAEATGRTMLPLRKRPSENPIGLW